MGALVDAEQAERLRRNKWTGPSGANRLAEEIYAIWTSKAPYQGDPINIIQQGDTPVINITIDGGNPITQGPPITGPIPVGEEPDPVIGGGGGSDPADTIINIDVAGLPAAFPIPGWAIVLSQTSGDTYNCSIYIDNPATSLPLGTMDVQQRQIDPLDTIPVGTETPCVLWTRLNTNGTLRVVSATMQVPVFLERP